MEIKRVKDLDNTARRGVYVAMALWFLMLSGFFMLIPLLSVHYVDELGWAAAFIGVVLAVRQFMQQGLTVFGGALADRFGAKGLIALGMLIRAGSFVLVGFAVTPALLLTAGVLAALGGALFDSPTRAVVAALVPESLLSDVYAQVGILQNLARTVGPLLGALLITIDFRVVALAAAGFFLLAFVVAVIGLPAVETSTEKQPVSQGLKAAFGDRAFITYTALMMGFWFMWVQISIALPLEAKALTNENSSVGMLLTVNAVTAVVLQVPVLKVGQKYLRPLPLLIVGIGAMAFGLGTVALVDAMWQLYLSVGFFALGSVLVLPNAQTVVATMAAPQARGAYLGVNSLALAVGGGIGQVTGGTMVDMAAALNWPALPWLVSAAVGTAAAVGLSRFYRRNRHAVTPRGIVAASGD